MAIIEAIATKYLELDSATVEWTSIPSTYESLAINAKVRTPDWSQKSIYLQFGTGGGAVDTGNNYSICVRYSISSTNYSTTNVSSGELKIYYIIPSKNENGNTYGQANITISDYANSNKNTTIQCNEGRAHPDTNGQRVGFTGGVWDNTAAVDRIKITGQSSVSFGRGSEFTLYGIKSS